MNRVTHWPMSPLLCHRSLLRPNQVASKQRLEIPQGVQWLRRQQLEVFPKYFFRMLSVITFIIQCKQNKDYSLEYYLWFWCFTATATGPLEADRTLLRKSVLQSTFSDGHFIQPDFDISVIRGKLTIIFFFFIICDMHFNLYMYTMCVTQIKQYLKVEQKLRKMQSLTRKTLRWWHSYWPTLQLRWVYWQMTNSQEPKMSQINDVALALFVLRWSTIWGSWEQMQSQGSCKKWRRKRHCGKTFTRRSASTSLSLQRIWSINAWIRRSENHLLVILMKEVKVIQPHLLIKKYYLLPPCQLNFIGNDSFAKAEKTVAKIAKSIVLKPVCPDW